MFFPMLHRHGIFGLVPMSDICWTQVIIRQAQNPCPKGVHFFFFFKDFDTTPTWHRYGFVTMDTENLLKN